MKKHLKQGSRKITVIHKRKTVSTNIDALKYPENTLVVANIQTGGKGRMGRNFVSNKGGVYMSLSLKTEAAAAEITTAAAVAAARAIEAQSGKKTQIKWVNDIYINGKKVCGILAESQTQNGHILKTVIGIGINLLKRTEFDSELKKKAGHIYESGNFRKLRTDLINRFLEEFFSLYDKNDKKIILNEYKKRDFLIGKKVSFEKNKQKLIGTVLGFDNDINLLVEVDKQIHTLKSGEVSVLPL